jgi:hypothetical protein
VRFDNNNVQPLRLAVLQILDTAIGQLDHEHPLYGDWSVQGFGVLRLYIRKVGRLHVWDDGLRYPNVSMIHTHSWDLTSTVVSGALTNIRYTEETVPGVGSPFKKQRLLTGYQSRQVSPVVDVNLMPWPLEELRAGDIYHQRAAEIHKTVARNGTVTLMERTEDNNGEADVYWPADCTWGTAKPRRATLDEVRTTVLKAIELLETNR